VNIPNREPLTTARSVVPIVMFGHFISAFAALGMPPFFAVILEKSLHSEANFLVGWFYVVPALFAAISSPWWGRLADRFGKKPLLIRAQIGLAASFLLAGYATNTTMFFFALVLQGILGGTFSASNAYLATAVRGAALMRSLTAMQWSARAALVTAPAVLGLWASGESPIVLYRYLALLPLTAALLILMLPNGGASNRTTNADPIESEPEANPRQIYLLQFAFVFATVVTFPYFIPYTQEQFGQISISAAGLLFGLPHLAYLVVAMPLTRMLGAQHLLVMTCTAFTLLAVSLIGHVYPISVAWLIACRLGMGIAMTAGFIALHALITGVVQSGTAGRTFGWFESSSKWGAVVAGLSAGVIVGMVGTDAPFVVGAFVIAGAAIYAAFLANTHRQILKKTY
jgi:MFS family permease